MGNGRLALWLWVSDWGVLATDVNWGEEGGSISPGGVGFDINCGVRMVALECSVDDIPNLDKLAGRLNGRIPSVVQAKVARN